MPVMGERLYDPERQKHAKSEPPAAVGERILELPPFRARKPEIRNSKPETNPKHQAGNDQNHYTAGGSWPWSIGHLNLFRVSGFGFRISGLGPQRPAVVSKCARPGWEDAI